MVKNYCYLNNGLTIVFNGEKYFSENGLKDLLEETIHADDLEYPIIHLKGGYRNRIDIVKRNIAKNTIRL
jgi:topoisomerase-4 subunit B